jgi:hypothetical protein
VGLISIAVALPVTLFLHSCFAIANSGDTPDSFLQWAGWRRLVFGLTANRRWNYTRGAQPRRYVRWHIRSGGEPAPKTVLNLCVSAYAWLTRSETPWRLRARQAEQAAAAAAKAHAVADDDSADDVGGSDCAVASYPADDAGSTPLDAARRLARHKRAMACAGLAGTYVVWAIFTWCGGASPLGVMA